MIIKKSACVAIVCLVWIAGSLVWAESGTPNLLGTWQTLCETGLVIRGDKPSDITHREREYTKRGEAVLVLTKQQGRILHGYYKSKRATERVVAVFGFDNNTLYMSCEDGMSMVRILSPDKMELIYLHAKPSDSAASACVLTRKKKQK